MRSAAPGSLTGEIARMLEIERQNREPADASAGTSGPAGSAESGSGHAASASGPAATTSSGPAAENGSSGRGLLRRARRAVTRPAGPPAAEPPPAAVSAPAAAAPPSPVAEQSSAAPATAPGVWHRPARRLRAVQLRQARLAETQGTSRLEQLASGQRGRAQPAREAARRPVRKMRPALPSRKTHHRTAMRPRRAVRRRAGLPHGAADPAGPGPGTARAQRARMPPVRARAVAARLVTARSGAARPDAARPVVARPATSRPARPRRMRAARVTSRLAPAPEAPVRAVRATTHSASQPGPSHPWPSSHRWSSSSRQT